MSPIEKLRSDRDYVAACLADLHAAGGEVRSLTADEDAAFDAGVKFVADTDKLIARHEQVAEIARTRPAQVESGATFGAPNVVVRNDPFDLSGLRIDTPDQEVRSRALRAVELTDGIDADERGKVEKVIRSSKPEVAKRILFTGSPEYREAFAIAATRGLSALRDAQRDVLERAAGLTDNVGGYAVPFTFDPTIIQLQARSTNPMRQIARIETTTTDSWNGVASAGVTFSWDAEAAQVSDDTPTLSQPSIPVHKGSGFVPFSVEIGGDWQNIEADLRAEFMVGKDNLEGAAFATGSGSGQPTGITKALDGGSSEIAPGTAETFAIGDIFKVEQALEARYRANASWIANKVIYNTVRQFGDADSYKLWERLGAGQPAQLLGYNAYEYSDMDGVLPNAAATADNFLMVLGDFRNYVIVDRVGVSVELVPHLFGADGRPTGQRGLYCWFRTGADSVNDAAFAMLSIPTAA